MHAQTDMLMFQAFQPFTVQVGDVTIAGRIGGSGPPLLLLHGHPQTHVIWHKLADRGWPSVTPSSPRICAAMAYRQNRKGWLITALIASGPWRLIRWL